MLPDDAQNSQLVAAYGRPQRTYHIQQVGQRTTDWLDPLFLLHLQVRQQIVDLQHFVVYLCLGVHCYQPSACVSYDAVGYAAVVAAAADMFLHKKHQKLLKGAESCEQWVESLTMTVVLGQMVQYVPLAVYHKAGRLSVVSEYLGVGELARGWYSIHDLASVADRVGCQSIHRYCADDEHCYYETQQNLANSDRKPPPQQFGCPMKT